MTDSVYLIHLNEDNTINKEQIDLSSFLQERHLSVAIKESTFIEVFESNGSSTILSCNKKLILAFTQLEDGNIICCLKDSTFRVWSITSKECIFTIRNVNSKGIIALPSNCFATCFTHLSIWKAYSKTPFKVLKGHKRIIKAMIYLKEQNEIISDDDSVIIEWSLSSFQCVSVIVTDLNCLSSLYQIDSNKLIVCDSKGQSIIINCPSWIIEERVDNQQFDRVTSYLSIKDYIIIGLEGALIIYDRKRKEKQIVDCNSKESIKSMIKIDEKSFLLFYNNNAILLK